MQINCNKFYPHPMENPQKNPLRYMVLHKLEEGFFENVSVVLKCKDYMNDFAYLNNFGICLTVYNVTSDPKMFNSEKGMWMLLINPHKNLGQNIENILNKEFGFGVSYTVLKEDEVDFNMKNISYDYNNYPNYNKVDKFGLIYLPQSVWNTNLHTSFFFGILRACSDEVVFPDWERLLNSSLLVENTKIEFNVEYRIFKYHIKKLLKTHKIKFYYSDTINSDVMTKPVHEAYSSYTVHDSGVHQVLSNLWRKYYNVGYYESDWMITKLIEKGI